MRLPGFGLPWVQWLKTDISLAETLRTRPMDLLQEILSLQGPFFLSCAIWILFPCPWAVIAMLGHCKPLAEKACLMPQASCFLSYNLLSKLVSGWRVEVSLNVSCSCEDPLVGVSVFISETVTVMRGTEVTDWNNPRLYVVLQDQSCFTQCTELRVRQEWLSWSLEFLTKKN